MEFWGVEVKPGKVLNSNLEDKYVHLSQAALGEIQNPKGNERTPLYVHVNGKKLLIGTLVFGKCDQLSLDLVFDGEFGLSHGCAAGNVFFSGYTSVPEDKDDGMEMGGDDSDSDSEDARQVQALMRRIKENEAKPVKSELKKEEAKPAKSGPVTTGKAAPKVKSEDDEESSDDDDNENEEGPGDSDSEESVDSEDESDEDENQKTPMVKDATKKRSLSKSATKSQRTADKKAKTTVPAEAKKSGTDGGNKDGPRTPAGPSKDQKGQTPKAKGTSGPKEAPKTPVTPGPGSVKKIGAHDCATCSRNFATESALSQHNAAKHGGK